VKRGILSVLAGLGLIVAFGVAACRSAPPPPEGAPNVTALASPSLPTASRSPSARPEARAVAPARLRVPAMDLDATVLPVGVDKAGDFAVPPSVDRVGWYRYGPGFAADRGSIVVAGHVDSAEQGEGAFFRLGRMRIKDEITLYDDNGAERRFRVVARERYAKSKIPLDRYFARDGAPRLTLITCGGPFDRRTGHYRDNVVVTATPVEPPR
jgi:hypothetical protein